MIRLWYDEACDQDRILCNSVSNSVNKASEIKTNCPYSQGLATSEKLGRVGLDLLLESCRRLS